MPQLENGYTRIADEILEKVAKTKLNGTQLRILLIVWRSTYGWQKKEHELSLNYLAKATGIHKQQIKKELDKLIKMEIIVIKKESTYTKPRHIGFNKNYLQDTKKVTVSEKAYPTVSKLTDPTVSELAYQNKHFNKQYNKEYEEALIINAEYDFSTVRKQFPGTKVSANAKKKLPKLIKKYGVKQMINTCVRYKAFVNKERNNGFKELKYMNESTFWSGRFEDYLDENYQEKEKPKVIKGDDVEYEYF